MQQITTQEHVEYASLGWRFAAVLVDTVVLVGLLIIAVMVYVLVLVAQGKVDPNDPTAAQTLTTQLQLPNWVANVIVFGGLFVYYFVLEAIFSASVGKLVFRMRVTMPDGSRPGGAAVLVRNLVRIPEAWLLYVPAGVSCLASARRQRLGDHAARTVVVRRRTAAGATTFRPAPKRGPARLRAASRPRRPGLGADPAGRSRPVPPAPAGQPRRRARRLKAAASRREAPISTTCASRSASCRRERSTAADAYSRSTSAPGSRSWGPSPSSSRRVTPRRRRRRRPVRRRTTSSSRSRTLAHLLRELGPNFPARSDEDIHEAFLIVARSEATPSS